MKVVVLAAGYGTRLEKDLKSDTSGKYSHLNGLPKALLPIGEIPLLSHWIKIFKEEEVEHVYIGTNDKYLDNFKKFADYFSPFVSVVSDGTTDNEHRLGAIGCLNFVCQHFHLNSSDLLVMAADTLFFEDFCLKKMLDRFNELKLMLPTCNTVQHGILETEGNNYRVSNFLEKPHPEETKSRNACPCFYVLSSGAIEQVDKFLEEKQNSPLVEKDAPGHFLKYLHKKLPVFIFPISGRYDVGNLNSYIKCNEDFLNREKAC